MVGKHYGENLMGDLRIISNKFKEIIWKGPKYCGHKTNFSEAKDSISHWLNFSSLCNKKAIPEKPLSEWKYLVKSEVELKINALKTKYFKFKTNNNMSHTPSINQRFP